MCLIMFISINIEVDGWIQTFKEQEKGYNAQTKKPHAYMIKSYI